MLIAIVDTETNNLDSETQEIIQIAASRLAISPDMWRFSQEAAAFTQFSGSIAPEASAIHHITEKTIGQPREKLLTVPLALQYLIGAEPPKYLVAHNAKFDSALVNPHALETWKSNPEWICTYKVALEMFPDAPRHTNQTLRYYLNLAVNPEIANNAHRADADVHVTRALFCRCLAILYETHGNYIAAVERMAEITRAPRSFPTCPIGEKWRGRPWDEVETSFLHWVIGKPPRDASDKDWGDIQAACRAELRRRHM